MYFESTARVMSHPSGIFKKTIQTRSLGQLMPADQIGRPRVARSVHEAPPNVLGSASLPPAAVCPWLGTRVRQATDRKYDFLCHGQGFADRTSIDELLDPVLDRAG